MRKSLVLLLSLIIFIFLSCKNKYDRTWKLHSPDSTICVQLSQNVAGSLIYTVMLSGDTMIHPSLLGIERQDQRFTDKLHLIESSKIKFLNDSYEMKVGKNSSCKTSANEQTFRFENDNGSLVEIIIRTANNGVAFKYRFPEIDTAVKSIINESTNFLVKESKTWIAPYSIVKQYGISYATYYENGIPSATVSPKKEDWCFPMLFNCKEKWMLISEANTSPACFATHLVVDTVSGAYVTALPDSAECDGYGSTVATSTLPWESSWRVIALGNRLSDIFENTIITDVCDAAINDDFSWVKSGRASWSWWSDPANSSRNAKVQKEYVDFAKEMGWEYILVDECWDSMFNGTIEEVIKYANAKNIGVWLWYNSAGPHNHLKDHPRDLMSDPVIRKKEMQKLKEWGVKGVKIDFFGSDKQFMIKQYHDILKDAAENKIMVNFHGCTLPKGWSRTYPNLVTMEAVGGSEMYLFREVFPEKAPVICCIYPFTRNVVGSMDYTPVAFSNGQYPHKTSYGFELATSVVFESGLVSFADSRTVYKNLPSIPKQFLKDVPASWDESRLIDGYPGKFAVIARRKGNDWYVAGITSSNVKTELNISLTMLTNGGYKATIIQDGKDIKSFSCSEKSLASNDSLKITMAPIGGFVVKLTPVKYAEN